MAARPLPSESFIDDADLARRIACHDEAAFETLIRHHNGALFRIARAILRNDAEAEDVLQEAYLTAYSRMADFRADAKLSTWLTRIVINQALARLRSRRRAGTVVAFGDLNATDRTRTESEESDDIGSSPEQSTARADIRRLLEQKIDALPVAFRTVFVLREMEDLSVDENAACLSIPEATVRSRMFRARGIAARVAGARARHGNGRCLPLCWRALRSHRFPCSCAPSNPRSSDCRSSSDDRNPGSSKIADQLGTRRRIVASNARSHRGTQALAACCTYPACGSLQCPGALS
jgi:RNA polymerase sigma-70 factor (ECF subfamily)